MVGNLRILLVGGPMYDPLYTRLGEFEERERTSVEVAVVPTHPELNERIEEEFGSGAASYDLISTHTKYAPSQRQWLTALDDDLDSSELERRIGRLLAEMGGLPDARAGRPPHTGRVVVHSGLACLPGRLTEPRAPKGA
jgi:multiple sugar transport system substrate-binding protein